MPRVVLTGGETWMNEVANPPMNKPRVVLTGGETWIDKIANPPMNKPSS
jgi:hypothetical protein